MRKIELEERKKIQLEILRSVASFCDENHISYFLSSGTLIGAIRHRGYIPWDDDIDIAMPRPDYEKFFQLFSSDIYKVVDSYRDLNFPFNLAKVIDIRTYIKEKGHQYDGFGVNVDIFPLDGIPAGNWKFKWHLFKIRRYRYIRDIKYLVVSEAPDRMRKIYYGVAQLFLAFLSRKFLTNKLYKLLTKYPWENALYVSSLSTYREMKPCLKKNFEKSITTLFEGETFKIPEGYDCWLRLIFGEYMQLPPENERIIPHELEAYELSESEINSRKEKL